MAFSFFTKRSEYTSKRLRFVARGLQIFGVIASVYTVTIAISVLNFPAPEWPEGMRDMFVRRYGLGAVGQLVSFFFIGHALLRRQRAGAYVAIATIGLSLLLIHGWPLNSNAPWFFYVVIIGLPVLTLALIASVWRELGSVRDSDMISHRPEPEQTIPLTPRNRGYGESRISATDFGLGPAPIDAIPANATAAQLDTIQNRRTIAP